MLLTAAGKRQIADRHGGTGGGNAACGAASSLNHPEAIALICDFVMEGARDGRSVADLMEAGAPWSSPRDQVMDGIAEMISRRPGGSDLSRWREACHRAQSHSLERQKR